MKRREFVHLATGAVAAWPIAAHAQQKRPPVIGYLSARALVDSADIMTAFQRGLAELGFVDKQNVIIETRFAEGHFDRLADLAADLVRLRVNVLVATGGTVTVAKAKPLIPPEIPIVFAMGGRPSEAWCRCQPQSTRREHHRGEFLGERVSCEVGRGAA